MMIKISDRTPADHQVYCTHTFGFKHVQPLEHYQQGKGCVHFPHEFVSADASPL